MCLSPITKRHDDGFINVPCGSCYQCLQNRRAQWTFRLKQEEKVSTNAMFLTLTYADEHLPKNGKICKREVQLFMKKLRKEQKKYTDEKIVYYFVGEYGEKTNRPHYHAILFNVYKKVWLEIAGIWEKGNIRIGTCTSASIHYVTGYVMAQQVDKERSFALMSKGIGKSYLTKETIKYHMVHNDLTVINEGGIEQPIPNYYRDKLYGKIRKSIIAKKILAKADQRDAKEVEKSKKRKENHFERMRRYEIAKERIAKKSKHNKI